MNKKTLTILIVSALILVAGIAAAIAMLYKGTGNSKSTTVHTGNFIENHRLIKAVPSDAAIVFCVKNFGKASEMIGDTVSVFSAILSDKFRKIAAESFPDLQKAEAIMSVHYSKDMPPLLAVRPALAISDTINNDCSRLIATAKSAGLFAKVSDNLILISSSETIINSSIRHLAEGHSVLEAKGFSELASSVSGDNIIFASNSYTDNILDAYFSRKFRKMSGFFKEMADWCAFTITGHSESGVGANGKLLYGSDHSFYLNVIRHAGTGAVGVVDAVPAKVDFIIDLPIGSLAAYIKSYRNYLDSKNRLDKYDYTLSKQLKENGTNAEGWAKSLDIKEIAVVNAHIGDRLRQFLLIKPGRKPSSEGIQDFSATAGYAKTLFGEIFTAEDESACTVVNGWIVAGAKDAVEKYSFGESLKERLSGNGLGDRIPQKNCGFWMYHSMTEDPTLIEASFSPSMARGFRNVIKGVSFVPVTAAALAEGDKMGISFHLDRTNISRAKAPVASADRDTVIVVPGGPWKVKNSGTGKTGVFYQNSHLSICLQDENGKDLWGIPFKYPLCGYVETIDYFNNGKLQYLFAADTRIYLIDRLGRFVGGFPVDLGKRIALGPKSYYFTGAKGYSVMVLHKDNTVGLYNLRGQMAASWKGITSKETIKSLPELIEGNGKKYWIVRTSVQTLVFPFNGGDPLVQGEGERMIRPDSGITFGEKGTVIGKCYDGKERSFKLDK